MRYILLILIRHVYYCCGTLRYETYVGRKTFPMLHFLINESGINLIQNSYCKVLHFFTQRYQDVFSLT